MSDRLEEGLTFLSRDYDGVDLSDRRVHEAEVGLNGGPRLRGLERFTQCLHYRRQSKIMLTAITTRRHKWGD